MLFGKITKILHKLKNNYNLIKFNFFAEKQHFLYFYKPKMRFLTAKNFINLEVNNGYKGK